MGILCQQYIISDTRKECESMLGCVRDALCLPAPDSHGIQQEVQFLTCKTPTQSLQQLISVKECAKFPLCLFKPSAAWPPLLSRFFTLQCHLREPQICHSDEHILSLSLAQNLVSGWGGGHFHSVNVFWKLSCLCSDCSLCLMSPCLPLGLRQLKSKTSFVPALVLSFLCLCEAEETQTLRLPPGLIICVLGKVTRTERKSK